MDFLKNLLSIFSNSNIDLTRILSTFGQNESSQNNIGNLSNIINLLSNAMQSNQSTPTTYKPLDYDEIYTSILDE